MPFETCFFALPKLLYTLHTSLCFLAPELQVFDSLFRSLLSSTLNINLTDSAWSQASFPSMWWLGGPQCNPACSCLLGLSCRFSGPRPWHSTSWVAECQLPRAGVRAQIPPPPPPLLVPQLPTIKEPGISSEWWQLLMPFWEQLLMTELVLASLPPEQWNRVPGCRPSPCQPLVSACKTTLCEWWLDCGWEPHSANHTTSSTVVEWWISLHCMVSAAGKSGLPSTCCCRGP